MVSLMTSCAVRNSNSLQAIPVTCKQAGKPSVTISEGVRIDQEMTVSFRRMQASSRLSVPWPSRREPTWPAWMATAPTA